MQTRVPSPERGRQGREKTEGRGDPGSVGKTLLPSLLCRALFLKAVGAAQALETLSVTTSCSPASGTAAQYCSGGSSRPFGAHIFIRPSPHPAQELTEHRLATPLSRLSVAKAGTQVIVPYRSADEARKLRVMGDLGQIVPMVSSLRGPPLPASPLAIVGPKLTTRLPLLAGLALLQEWEMRNPHQIEECLRHSDVVYNIAGLSYETRSVQHASWSALRFFFFAHTARSSARSAPIRNYSFEDVHVTGAASIAEIAAKNNVSRFIHVSHLNADHNSKSALYRVSPLVPIVAHRVGGE